MNLRKVFFPILVVAALISCQSNVPKEKQLIEKYWESLDSSGFSLYLGNTIEKQKIFIEVITANVETDPVASAVGIDAADDPAIWVNKQNPEKSLILGANKKGGIHVFGLQGVEKQYVNAGCMNNIDLRNGFNYLNKEVVLVAASNCALNTISLFYIDKEKGILSDTICNIKSNVDLVYGLCMYKSKISNTFYIFVNGEGAEVEQWKINSDNNKISATLVRNFKVSSRPEGMVADDENEMLYIGVEEEGILKVKAEPEHAFVTDWVSGSNPTDRSLISSDIEGLSIYKTDSIDYLMASSQGNFSYAVFRLNHPDKYLFSFVIKDGLIDGVTETDGIEITSAYLGERFPKGMIVLQDGYNFNEDTLNIQNFKYVSWEKIDNLLRKYY